MRNNRRAIRCDTNGLPTAEASPRPYTRWIFGAVLGLVTITFGVAFGIMARHGAPFEDVAASAAPSVFLVAIEDGATRTAVGTAFAVNSKSVLATNAHIAMELDRRGALSGRSGIRAIVIQDATSGVRRITAAATAPGWTAGSPANDIALLQLEALPATSDNSRSPLSRVWASLTGSAAKSRSIPALKLGNPEIVEQAVRGASLATFGFPRASTDASMPAGRLFVSFVDELRPGLLHVGRMPGDASGSPLLGPSGMVVGMIAGDDGWAVTATQIRRLLEE
jgi:hypothetical protein